MAVEPLPNLKALLADELTGPEMRLIEAELCDRVLSAKANLNYQQTLLELVRAKLAALGIEPLLC